MKVKAQQKKIDLLCMDVRSYRTCVKYVFFYTI